MPPMLPHSTDPMWCGPDSPRLEECPPSCSSSSDDDEHFPPISSLFTDTHSNLLTQEEIDFEKQAGKFDIEVRYKMEKEGFALSCFKMVRKNGELIPPQPCVLWEIPDKLHAMPPGAFVFFVDLRNVFAINEAQWRTDSSDIMESIYNGQPCLRWMKLGRKPKFNKRWEVLQALKDAEPGVGIIFNRTVRRRSQRLVRPPNRFC